METVTINEFIEELKSYCTFSKYVLRKAKKSEITSANNEEFKNLLYRWCDGIFDNDVDGLQALTESILLREKETLKAKNRLN